MTYTVNQSIY